jgi:probable HAF family extracellular repeat protein
MVGLGSLPGLNESFAGGVSADGSVIVGTAHTNAAFLAAFRWTEDDGLIGLGNLPGDIQSHAEAVSGDGSVVGGSSQGPIEPGFNPSQAFRWSEEEGIVGLGLGNLPGRRTSHVDALSADGSIIVGGIIGDQIGQHGSVAFVWDAHRGIRLLQEVLVDDYGLDLMGWTLSGASGISADGRTIVGSGYNPDGQFEGWIAVLPEPSIGGLLALGIAGLAGKRRLFA